MGIRSNVSQLDGIRLQLTRLRDNAVELEKRYSEQIALIEPGCQDSARNLLHYLSMRQNDIRPLQQELSNLGLSSLGTLEPHVMASINAVQDVLDFLIDGPQSTDNSLPAESFDSATVARAMAPVTMTSGPMLLKEHANTLLGPEPEGRMVRIMVTMPSEAADDPDLIENLLRAGMNLMRINCAHDGPEQWQRMVENLRCAEQKVGRKCRIQADLAGPKLRTGRLHGKGKALRLKSGDVLILMRSDEPGGEAQYDLDGQLVKPARIHLTLSEAFDQVTEGQQVWFDDGKIGGVVLQNDGQEIRVKITYAGPKGAKLRAEKGVNFPDTSLEVDALTEKDIGDLQHIASLVDIVALSFVRCADDVLRFQDELQRLNAEGLAVVLKIENRQAFNHLPEILLAALQSGPVAVMVARGDLAVEVGFERLSEVQQEILWICEAAHVPVIWATQILERMAKKGAPSRSEVTDAGMSVYAECAMLNKGPYIVETVRFLDGIIHRMDEHYHKRRSTLRKLSVANLRLP